MHRTCESCAGQGGAVKAFASSADPTFMQLRLGFGILAVCFALAAPTSAEIYRWTDESGRQHFTMDLHGVPPEHRAEAKRRAALGRARVDPGPAPINTMTTPDSARVKRALRPRRHRRASSVPAETRCTPAHRRQAQDLARAVERWEKQVALEGQLASRLVRTEDRLRADSRAERYEIRLEDAQQALEQFEDRMRQQGVLPGCYR